MRYIIVPVSGCPIDKECGHDKWRIDCSFNERAVYYTRYDEDKKYDVPTGVPIMFLRQYGMQSAAQELIDLANRE